MAVGKKQLEIFNKIAIERGLTVKEVESIYNSPFDFIRNITKDLPVKELDDEEAIRQLKTNFTIPSLGKLYLNVPKVMKFKEIQNDRNK